MSEMKDAALTYAARGWYVIPVHGINASTGQCTCGRPACPTPGKHPIMAGAFHKYASVDPTIVGQWWHTWPEANIGVVCGEQSNLWVLDIDGAHGAMELDTFEEQRTGGPLPETPKVRTGSGGLHFYWRWTEAHRMRTKIAAHFGVDVKANGFVVAPPSRHASGANYEWEIEGVPIAAPNDLVTWLKGDPDAKPEDEWPSITEMLRSGLPEGRRDDGMFHAALTLKRSGMTRHDAEAIIERIAMRCTPPFPHDQARAKIDAAWKFDEEARRDEGPSAAQKAWAEAAAQNGGTGNGDEGAETEGLWPGFGGVTDRDNAERLRALWSEAHPLVGGGWVVYDGQIWQRSDRPTLAAGHKLYEVLTREMRLVELTNASALAKWRQACGATARINAALAQMESAATLTAWDLDPDPWVMGVKNGVLDLRTGELRDYRREDMITRQANAEWMDGQVDCPHFKQTLRYGITGESDQVATEIMEALQAFFGVCLTGVSVKNFMVLYGPGNTGKSSLIEAFAYAMGAYATAAPRGLLTLKRGSNETHPTILTELEGRRFVYASEPGAGEELNIELIKDITGGAELKARKMRQDFYSFRTECKPLIDTNHALRLRDVSPALEERMISIGLLSAIPQEARVSRTIVHERLKLEASGVLAWAWRGLQRVLEKAGGVLIGDLTDVLGESILDERREMINEQDIVAQWVSEYLEETGNPEDILPAADVRSAYTMWAALHGVSWSPDIFVRELRTRLAAGVGMQRRYPPVKARTSHSREGNPQRAWRGLRLRAMDGEHTL